MDPGALSKLVADLVVAVHVLSGYAMPAAPPEVAFLPHAELERRACEGPCAIYGWFPPGRVVYLDERLDPVGNVQARGVLVHELVHFLQQESGTYLNPDSCSEWSAREAEAFHVQFRWLAQQRVPVAALAVPQRMLYAACDDARQRKGG